jgi:3-methyladenine DNA glycosylase/8-oxoguanine DNA glycosylase
MLLDHTLCYNALRNHDHRFDSRFFVAVSSTGIYTNSIGDFSLEPDEDFQGQLEALNALPGIGEWTAQYIAMRALAWPDAFPHSDYGIRKALGETSNKRILAIAEPWRPWRAYATLHLWCSLEKILL